MENKSWQGQVEEGKVKVYLPKPPRENVTAEMREGGFHMDSYILGRRRGINDCIHYLKQQGYRIAHENDEEVIEGEWIEWSGGECPLENEEVRVEYRTALGSVCDELACDLRWYWTGLSSPRGGDIIAYRVIG